MILLREFPVAQAGVVTVNDVALAGDLQSATVYVGVIGTPQQRKQVLARLDEQTKRLQGLVGAAVSLKHTPLLRFALDDSVERGNRVLRILDEIEKGLPRGPA